MERETRWRERHEGERDMRERETSGRREAVRNRPTSQTGDPQGVELALNTLLQMNLEVR